MVCFPWELHQTVFPFLNGSEYVKRNVTSYQRYPLPSGRCFQIISSLFFQDNRLDGTIFVMSCVVIVVVHFFFSRTYFLMKDGRKKRREKRCWHKINMIENGCSVPPEIQRPRLRASRIVSNQGRNFPSLDTLLDDDIGRAVTCGSLGFKRNA